MIVSTTERIPGYEVELLGIVFGNTVRSKHLGKDITAFLKSLVGGELQEYTDMLIDARQEAMNRMINEASKLGADGVVNVRFATSQTGTRAAELIAYGTAVKLKRI
ncbi:MAG: YbjQ family protein [Methanotrichaceae archaeon]|nr:YbjQ family protein [Methanotrichaceae archaeon]